MNPSRRTYFLIGATFGVAFAIGTVRSAAYDANVSMSDKHFVSAALEGGMAEVQMGKLAEEKGGSADVKRFGHKMVEDHTKLGDQMKSVAEQIGLAPPASPSIFEQMEFKKLEKLSGDQFDQEYIKTMVKDHESDLKDFRKEANSGTSPAVKSAASEGADVVSKHLSMIRQIAQEHHIDVK